MTTGEGVAISDIPESEPVADTDLPEPLASDATELALSEPADMPDVDPSTAARHDLSIHELAAPATMAVPGPERDRSEPIIQNDHEPSPGSVAIPTANDAGDSRLPTATKAPTPDRTATSQAPERATGAAPPARNESILSTLARQRQTHDRLRQNLRDLRENRVKLQDALSELQQDYPERFERMAAGESPKGARQATESQKPASWTLLGHLQSLGHGYWEWSAADGAGPSVRLN
ncbi:MAG: hypothetical protein H7338_18740 [Candidatus Sericytochromatia bacterium]|nr:hypothetical protein [Candidatus Sericytochromatia bacterium]